MIELVEDLQMRALKRITAFAPSKGNAESGSVHIRLLTASSRYGLTIAVIPGNKVLVCLSAEISSRGLAIEGEQPLELGNNFSGRIVEYHDPKSHITVVDVNSEGSLVAFGLNAANGVVFVEIFDVTAYYPWPQNQQHQQPFPLLRIPLATEGLNTSSRLECFEWNPELADTFVAFTSDGTLSTIRVAFEPTTSFTMIGVQKMTVPVSCISWSPKGKQISIGDTQGRVHQLKLELTSLRVIEPPNNLPMTFGKRVSCSGLSWITTTEWLAAYHLDGESQLNIAVLEVKKQAAPRWTFFTESSFFVGQGESSQGPIIRFFPLLQWKMVFFYLRGHSRVELCGVRGDRWVQFEFETFDIHLPLTAQLEPAYPLGCVLDFSSTHPIKLDQFGVQVPPQPVVHALSNTGMLCSYSVVPVGNQTNFPALTKAPEQCSFERAQFGAPSPIYQQTLAEKQRLQASQGQQQQPISTPTAPAQSYKQVGAQILSQQNVEQSVTTSPSVASITGTNTTPTISAPETARLAAVQRQEEERKKKAAADATAAEKVRQAQAKAAKEKAEAEELERKEQALSSAIVEHTAARNKFAQEIDVLRELRCQVQAKSTSMDTEGLDELGDLCREIQMYYDEALFGLKSFQENAQNDIETTAELRLCLSLMAEKQQKDEVEQTLSFDMRKRVEVLEETYERILQKFAKMRLEFDKLVTSTGTGNKRRSEQIRITRAKLEPLDPVEQNKVLNTTENIGKMTAKLGQRLAFLQRQLNVLSASSFDDTNGALANQTRSSFKHRKTPTKHNSPKLLSVPAAEFCSLPVQEIVLEQKRELDRMHLGFSGKVSIHGDEKGVEVEKTGDKFDEFFARQQRLAAIMTAKPALVKHIPAFLPTSEQSKSSTPITPKHKQQQLSTTPKSSVNGRTDVKAEAIVERLQRVAMSPRPEMISVATQSPRPRKSVTRREKDTRSGETSLTNTANKVTSGVGEATSFNIVSSLQSTNVQQQPTGAILFRDLSAAQTPISAIQQQQRTEKVQTKTLFGGGNKSGGIFDTSTTSFQSPFNTQQSLVKDSVLKTLIEARDPENVGGEESASLDSPVLPFSLSPASSFFQKNKKTSETILPELVEQEKEKSEEKKTEEVGQKNESFKPKNDAGSSISILNKQQNGSAREAKTDTTSTATLLAATSSKATADASRAAQSSICDWHPPKQEKRSHTQFYDLVSFLSAGASLGALSRQPSTPTTAAAATVAAPVAAPALQKQSLFAAPAAAAAGDGDDMGMEDVETALSGGLSMGFGQQATSASAPITFSFTQAASGMNAMSGLGSSTAMNNQKSAFGTAPKAFAALAPSPFNQMGTPSNLTAASSSGPFSNAISGQGSGASSLFSVGGTATISAGSQQPGGSVFGGAGGQTFGSSAFAAAPSFGLQSPFSAGAAGRPIFGGSVFGSTNASSSTAGTGSTFGGGGGGGGFAAFAAKSSAFGELAKSSPSTGITPFQQQQQSPQPQQSLFGGGQKQSAAFTAFRK